MSEEKKPKKVFISYSWEPDEHAELALELAERLVSDGIVPIIDKWNLRGGQDTIAFMESMVNEPTIDFVLLLCSRIYTEKANGRMGGVGTEGTIVSSEIYGRINQTKFVPIVLEKDECGKAYMPTYLRALFHIDLSSNETYENGYEQLVRHIYGKPLHVMPELGTPPPYIVSDNDFGVTCYGKLTAFINAVHKQHPMCSKYLRDFQINLLDNIERLRIKRTDIDQLTENERQELVKQKIEASCVFTHMFEELVDIFAFGIEIISEDAVFRFLEAIIDHCVKVEGELTREGLSEEMYFDVYCLVQYELFLLLINVLLHAENYQLVKRLTTKLYQINEHPRYQIGSIHETANEYTIFNRSLSVYDKNGEWRDRYRRHYCLFIGHRLQRTNIQDLIETDFLLSVISWCLGRKKIIGSRWSDYINHQPPESVRIFKLMETKDRFVRVSVIFSIDSVKEFKELLTDYSEQMLYNRNIYQHFDHYLFSSK